MSRAHGARSQAAFAFESSYGTAPGSGFTKIPFATCDIGAMQGLLDSEILGYGRDPQAPTPDAIDVDGDIAVPVDARFFGFWLKALFGAPTTTGSDPYTHVFTTGGWSLPSFALEIGLPEVPSYAMNAGLRADELSIAMTRKGQLTAGIKLIGQSETLATSAQSGALALMELLRFGQFHGYVKRNDTAMANVTAANLRYANGMERIETIRADGLVEGVDPGVAAMTGSLSTRFDTTALLTQAINGESCSLEFGWARDDASLTIVVHEVYLPRPKRSLPGPQGVQADFDWVAALNAAEECMATITLVNDVEAY